MVFGNAREIDDHIEAIKAALLLSALQADHGQVDMPSPREIRELLHLFAMLPSEATRQAVLALLRAIVGSS